MSNRKLSVTIIGTGALGSTLRTFFEENGYRICSTWNSSGGKMYSDESRDQYKTDLPLPSGDSETGDLIFITTPDDLISELAESLSGTFIHWKGKTVIHCSGNLTSDELQPLSKKGALTLSMHPIQTFKKGDGEERFKDITISLQGDEEAKQQLVPILKKMGAKSLDLTKEQKRTLHIAAVMASNYLVALMFSVQNLLKDAELEDGFDALKTLVHQTVTNIFKKGPADALTGPIARGDNESVHTHLKELKGREQEKLYKILGLEAVKIAKKSGKLSKVQNNGMEKILKILF